MSVPSGSAVRQVQWLIYVLVAFQAAPAALSEESNESLMLSLQYRNARDLREMFADVKTLIALQAQQTSDLMARLDSMETNLAQQTTDMKTLIARQAQQTTDMKTLMAHQAQQTTDMKTLKAHQAQQTTDMKTLMAHQAQQTTDMKTLMAHQAQQTTDIMNTLSEGCKDKNSSFGKLFAVDSVITVPCDGQGWAIIQRRVDGAFNFPSRTWDEYKVGFGDKEGSFWLGLESMHRLTSASPAMLRVELTSFEGEMRYAEYTSFRIEGEEEGYRIHVNGYSGTAGDSMKLHDGMKFSTVDRDQDVYPERHCAERYLGAWWHHACFDANLNSMYRPTGIGPTFKSILWNGWLGWERSYKTVAMKLRFV